MATIRNAVNVPSAFESIPGDVLLRILGFLDPISSTRCVNLTRHISHCLKEGGESKSFWASVLRDENLDGETYDDWARQMREWSDYKGELLSSLRALPPPESIKPPKKWQFSTVLENVTPAESLRDDVANRIAAYTHRVANSHSWYKHIAVTSVTVKFDFLINLCSRMRKTNDKWIDYVRGDGTEFHYTWSTTADYRHRFGHFEYHYTHTAHRSREASQRSTVSAPTRIGVVDENAVVCVPKSRRGLAVDVTSAVHGRCLGYNLYDLILKEAVSKGVDLLESPLDKSVLQWCSKRAFAPGGLLPPGAAKDLNKFTRLLLSEDPSSAKFSEAAAKALAEAYPAFENICDLSDLVPDLLSEDNMRGLAKTALLAQHWRELLAIGDSLLECCVHAYGRDATPSATLVHEYIISSDIAGIDLAY